MCLLTFCRYYKLYCSLLFCIANDAIADFTSDSLYFYLIRQ